MNDCKCLDDLGQLFAGQMALVGAGMMIWLAYMHLTGQF
jgi:hypothetical protein